MEKSISVLGSAKKKKMVASSREKFPGAILGKPTSSGVRVANSLHDSLKDWILRVAWPDGN
jgi:hypothetical protein